MKRLAVIALGSRRIGTGHLFRAKRLIDRVSALVELQAFLITSLDPDTENIRAAIRAEVLSIPSPHDPSEVLPSIDVEMAADHVRMCTADLVLLDLLDTSEETTAPIAEACPILVTFDNRGEGRALAKLIFNCLVDDPAQETLPPECRLYQGPDYVVLDRDFIEHRGSWHGGLDGPIRSVFVTLGGADAAGLTVKAAQALCEVKGVEEVRFNCGPAFPHIRALEEVVVQAPWQARFCSGLPSLVPEFQQADLALVAGGLTMHEACCIGVPAVAICQPIDHQLLLGEKFKAAGAMATVGYGELATVEQIAECISTLSQSPNDRWKMYRAGPELVDGLGVKRVAELIAAELEATG